jgi:hypothetical protein
MSVLDNVLVGEHCRLRPTCPAPSSDRRPSFAEERRARERGA